MGFRKGQKVSYRHGKGMAVGKVLSNDNASGKVTLETKNGGTCIRDAANCSLVDKTVEASEKSTKPKSRKAKAKTEEAAEETVAASADGSAPSGELEDLGDGETEDVRTENELGFARGAVD